MKRSQKGIATFELLLFAIIVPAVGFMGWYVYSSSQDTKQDTKKQQNQTLSALSAEQIAEKFDCNRITDNFRFTDVFCGNPKFYNNPDSITYDDYYQYYGCDERLKGEPPAESAKTNDPGYYNAYYNCKDKAKIESLRQDFIKELEKLRAENS